MEKIQGLFIPFSPENAKIAQKEIRSKLGYMSEYIDTDTNNFNKAHNDIIMMINYEKNNI